MSYRTRVLSAVFSTMALQASGVSSSFAQDSSSAALAKQFAQLAGGEMRYIAAKVPESPNEFVGALHIPGVQLLVIWAQYQQPSLLVEMLGKQNYQGVYSDLNAASYTIAASRVILEDIREDGLSPKRGDDNAPIDVYENGGKRVSFDGDWKKQKLTEKDYQDAFTAADQKYAKALALLTAELKKKGI